MTTLSEDVNRPENRNELFFPTSHDEVILWLTKFAASQDGLDPAETSSVYEPQATLRFSNYPAIIGADKIEEMVAARFARLSLINHTYRYFDLVGSRLWAVFDVLYRVKGDLSGEEFLVPAVCVFTLVEHGDHEGKITDLETFMDQTAVENRMKDIIKE
ncbi:uncharacterized protein TrAtP1_002403 [Trichoderma atroviride]|uniref:SnoaL-like domain-containing protein n=1 Tax=Hypocrea atroviridis (strain ATCC 20476 / IMI 206040) TaxID=452589 RepID=G9P1S8_HYPAI|nr:uncharacterized protein TRIATDRAFT_310167 [Trichoderma atroviride IMI 206040]EHK42577.1 hypothetical protein TRIATDRAFT_310167 [Trichoderma atroviride IMI 206040]UKZ61132.1 hypothetical protein TrAtP1_002403 [Trichoderma atroviride]